MSKKTTAGPSASAGGAGAINTGAADAPGEGPVASGGSVDVANEGATLEGASHLAATDEAAADQPVVAATKLDWLAWASSLTYPMFTTLRNNGHVAVVEPETAQILGGGGAVSVALMDEGHAVRVLDNTVHLNALHFRGELKVRLDAAPDELYLKG